MAARQLEIGDLLATSLERFLTVSLPGTTVERTYTPFVTEEAFDAALTAAKAMLVYVVPLRKVTSIETRAEDQGDYSYRIVFAEKCKTQADLASNGLPTNAWMDTRVNLVDGAEEEFGDMRNAFDDEHGKLWAIESEIAIVFDSDAHAENGTFWSVWHLTLREYA